MLQQLRNSLRLLLCLILFNLLLIECKKTEDTLVKLAPIPQTSTDIRPGENVGYGALFKDQQAYNQLPLLPEPQAGGRLPADKNPALPASYDLSAKMPPVDNQGQQGSCVAWAVAYAARSYFNATAKSLNYVGTDGKRNDEAVFSPAFVYNQVKASGCGAGSYISDALNLLQNVGVCSWKVMPYNANDCNTQPTVEQKQQAANFKIKKWGRVPITVNSLRKYLYYDYAIIIAQRTDKHFDYPSEKDASGEYVLKTYTGEGSRSGHAMVMVGYDDNRKAFKIQNSWSTGWANKGFIWLSYDIVEQAIGEAYVMVVGDNSGLKLPKVQTGIASKQTNGQVNVTGTITELGDEPILRYGICASLTRELPTSQFTVDGKPVLSLPHSFSVTPTLSGSRIYFRAFVETPTAIVYGDTASISPIQSTTQPGGVSKNLLIFHSSETVFAINADDGTLAWKTPSSYASGSMTGGVIAGTTYCIGDYQMAGFSLTNGKLLWQAPVRSQSSGRNDQHFPVAGNGVVYNFSGRYLTAYDATNGTQRWELNLQSVSESQLPIGNSLSISGNNLYFISGGSYNLLSINATEPTQPKQLLSGAYGNPLIVPDLIAVSSSNSPGPGNDGGMRGYSPSANKILWTSQTSNGVFPMLIGNTIYSTNYSTSDKTYSVVAINQATGGQRWKYTLTQGTVEYGTLSGADNTIAVVKSERQGNGVFNFVYSLLLIDASTGQLRREIQIPSSKNPLTVGSKVYIQVGKEMAAYDVNSGQQIWISNSVGESGQLAPPCFIGIDGKTYHVPQSGMQQ